MSGPKHLHALKLVHRDIKPRKILVLRSKAGAMGDNNYRGMLIRSTSDLGLCKKLDSDQTSFQPIFTPPQIGKWVLIQWAGERQRYEGGTLSSTKLLTNIHALLLAGKRRLLGSLRRLELQEHLQQGKGRG